MSTYAAPLARVAERARRQRAGSVIASGLSVGWVVTACLAGGFFWSTRAALCVAFASALTLLAATYGVRPPSRRVIALALFAVVLLASPAWGGSDPVAAASLPLCYAGALWLSEQCELERLLRALRIGVLVVCAVALVGGVSHLAPTAGTTSARLQWPITYANGLGLVAATGVLLWVVLPARRPVLGRIAGAVCGATEILTYSRAATVGLVVALGAWAVLRRGVSRRVVLAGSALAVAAALWLGPGLVSGFRANAPDPRAAARLVSLSGHGRVEVWQQALRAGMTRPLTGIGPGRFRTAAGGTSAHSLPMQTFVDVGLLGIVVLGAFFVSAFDVAGPSPVAASILVLWAVVASVDWVWQLPACTIPAIVAIGGLRPICALALAR